MTTDDRVTLLHCMLHWERATPDRVYMTQPMGPAGAVTYTWRQVGDQARRIAAYIKSLNLPPQSNIALLGKNSAHWIMADLAIWMAGHVTVPLYPTLNAETARYIIDHSEAKLLFVGKMEELWKFIEAGIPASLPRIGMPLSPLKDVPQWDDLVRKHEPLKDPKLPDPQALATIVYTSGSTGKPKGVMHSHFAMLRFPVGASQIVPASGDDRMLSYLPLAHVAERAIVESNSLYFGFPIFFAWSLETFVEDIRRARPTIFFSVPRLWTKFYLGVCAKMPLEKQKALFRIPILSRIVKKKILTQLGLQDVRFAVTGSAPLPGNIIEWYRSLGLELLDCYGMSENFAYSHGSRPGRTRVGSVGEVAPGVECKLDPKTKEVLVKSPGQMLGYYKDPQKTAEDMTPDGFLKTGDMGEIDEMGRLRITGRVKELFKTSKGKYVAPAPIEQKLCDHPMVESVCVAGFNLPQPIALMMLSADAQKNLKEGGASRESLAEELKTLLGRVNETLEDHEHMDSVIVVSEQWTMDNGFLTPTMKIKRNVIEGHYEPKVESWAKARKTVVWE